MSGTDSLWSATWDCVLCGGTRTETVIAGIKDWEFGVYGIYDYVRCMNCKQVQIAPMPSLETLKAAYPPSYSCHLPKDESRGVSYRILSYFANRPVLALINSRVSRAGRILDVGCGDGQFLVGLSGRGYKHLYGIDFSPEAVKLASENEIQTFCGTFLEYQTDLKSFDLLVMNNYLEHVLDPVAELKYAKLLLRQGCLIIGETPNFNSIDRIIFGKYWGGNHIPRHTFQYGPTRLKDLLINAGFKNVSVKCQVNTGTLALSVQNILQSFNWGRKITGRLRFGRAWYFLPLLVIMIPFSLVFRFFGRSGVLKFEAIA